MANQLIETPNGCKIDNGRCFDRLEWIDTTQTIYAYFRDGSEYEYFGLDEADARDWLAQLDPGCWFNKQIWPGTYIRRRPPN